MADRNLIGLETLDRDGETSTGVMWIRPGDIVAAWDYRYGSYKGYRVIIRGTVSHGINGSGGDLNVTEDTFRKVMEIL